MGADLVSLHPLLNMQGGSGNADRYIVPSIAPFRPRASFVHYANHNRQNVCLDGMLFAGKTTFSSHLRTTRATSLLSPSQGPSYLDEWNKSCALEFIGAYRDFFNLAKQRLTSPADQSLDSARLLSPHPRDLFLPGTPSHMTIASGRPLVLRTVAPALLINIMLFEQQDSTPEEIAYQYWALRRKFQKCDVYLGSGPAFLTYALGCEPDMKSWTDCQWMLLLGRMLSVEARLSDILRRRVEASLLGFVSATVDEEAVNWYDPDELEATVGAELFTSG